MVRQKRTQAEADNTKMKGNPLEGKMDKQDQFLTVVVAQLVEQLLPTPEVYGSYPIISKYVYRTCWLLLTAEKTLIDTMNDTIGL